MDSIDSPHAVVSPDESSVSSLQDILSGHIEIFAPVHVLLLINPFRVKVALKDVLVSLCISFVLVFYYKQFDTDSASVLPFAA